MNTQLLHRFFVIVSLILIASVSILSAQTEMTLTPVKDNTAENFGWILVGNESSLASAKRFDSRENGTENNRPELTVAYTEPTGVISSSEGIIPEEFGLEQNYPNPFNPSTLIRYTLPQSVNNTNIQTVNDEEFVTGSMGQDDQGYSTVSVDDITLKYKIEFLIPLNSGDAYDRRLNQGQSYPVLLARGNRDDFTIQHTKRGQVLLGL